MLGIEPVRLLILNVAINCKKCFLFHFKIGKGLDESIKWSVSILDTSEDGFQKLENEPTNPVEGKEDHSKSENDSEFDNMFNCLRKVTYPDSDNTGKFNHSYRFKKCQNFYVSFILWKNRQRG